MIRVAIFFTSVGLLALGVAWLADRPGEVSLVWLGYRVETSVMVAAAALIVLMIAVVVIGSLLRAILRSPDQVSMFLRHRRQIRGYLAITRGLIAVGAGDARVALRSAEEAARLSPNDPLALLLTAQSAQMSGDRAAAEAAFKAMASRVDTKLFGLRGLYIEAQRRNDVPAARLFAEEAVKTSPATGWAAQAVLDDRAAAGDWNGALESLDAMKGDLQKPLYRRQRAVLLTARALALADSDRNAALTLALEATKLAPDLIPAAALAGRRLAEAGETRKAAKIIEAAWILHPHPDLAEVYADLRLGDSARERRARIKKLADKAPSHIESALALARTALDAGEYAQARSALAAYAAAPTRRVAALMAQIEETEHGDEGRAREWLARAARAAPDAAWTADGMVSERWMPVSPVSGRLDAFTWRVPLAAIGAGPNIDAETAIRPNETSAVVPAKRKAPARGAQRPARKGKTEKVPSADAVIPLVHAPDDPGPDVALDSDPVPETADAAPATRHAPWQRWRELFR
ncbi:MAG: heme biosynthesis protein HemY [Pseudolabrys sp.]|nr:heme biosynthesis protein HemY [Pseudolabrys sp.]